MSIVFFFWFGQSFIFSMYTFQYTFCHDHLSYLSYQLLLSMHKYHQHWFAYWFHFIITYWDLFIVSSTWIFFNQVYWSLLVIIQKNYFLILTTFNICSFSFTRILIYLWNQFVQQVDIVLVEYQLLLDHYSWYCYLITLFIWVNKCVRKLFY